MIGALRVKHIDFNGLVQIQGKKIQQVKGTLVSIQCQFFFTCILMHEFFFCFFFSTELTVITLFQCPKNCRVKL